MLILGSVVKTADVGEGKAQYQINLGDSLINLMPIIQVADMQALKDLPEQINMESDFGFEDEGTRAVIVQVMDDGSGQSARFVHTSYSFAEQDWHRIDENNRVVLPSPDFTLNSIGFINENEPYYASGTLIRVEDVGNGKTADYVYVVNNFSADSPIAGISKGDALRIQYYQVADMQALQSLTDSTDLLSGVQVDVANAEDGQAARFVFDGTDWVRYGNLLEVADLPAAKR